MAKKSSKKSYAFLLAALLGVIAIVLYFIPMLTYHAEVNLLGINAYNEVKLSGFNLVFGAKGIKGVTFNNVTKTTTDYSLEFKEVKAAVGPLIAAICSAVGIIAVLLAGVIGKKNKMIVKVVAFVAFIAAAVLVVAITKATFVSANEISENGAEFYKLAIGAYIICGCNAIAGLVSLVA